MSILNMGVQANFSMTCLEAEIALGCISLICKHLAFTKLTLFSNIFTLIAVSHDMICQLLFQDSKLEVQEVHILDLVAREYCLLEYQIFAAWNIHVLPFLWWQLCILRIFFKETPNLPALYEIKHAVDLLTSMHDFSKPLITLKPWIHLINLNICKLWNILNRHLAQCIRLIDLMISPRGFLSVFFYNPLKHAFHGFIATSFCSGEGISFIHPHLNHQWNKHS